jgi:uncharacterized protein YceK
MADIVACQGIAYAVNHQFQPSSVSNTSADRRRFGAEFRLQRWIHIGVRVPCSLTREDCPSSISVCVVVIAILTAGCGTWANTCWFTEEEGGMRVFGGVRSDWEIARESLAPSSGRESSPAQAWIPIFDMPLSALGDTVTLPITISVAMWRVQQWPTAIQG